MQLNKLFKRLVRSVIMQYFNSDLSDILFTFEKFLRFEMTKEVYFGI